MNNEEFEELFEKPSDEDLDNLYVKGYKEFLDIKTKLDVMFSNLYQIADKFDKLLKSMDFYGKFPFGKHKGKPLNAVPWNYISWLAENGAFNKPDNIYLKYDLIRVYKDDKEKLKILENNN